MYTFPKPLFEKNDIRLAKFAQMLSESGECCAYFFHIFEEFQ
jgi:hypothetical protein